MNNKVLKFIKDHKYILLDNNYPKLFEDALDSLSVIQIKLTLKYLQDAGLDIDEHKQREILMRGVMREELPETPRRAYWLSYFADGKFLNFKASIHEWLEAIKKDPWFNIWYTDSGLNGKPDYVVLCQNVPLGSFVNFINNLQTGVQYYADEFEKVT